MQKELSQISRSEWIAFQWIEAPRAMGDEDRTFMTDGKRTPTEAAQAAEEWDMTAEERAEFA